MSEEVELPSPAVSRAPHSSAAFLHHLHTDPTSHHITLSASASRIGPSPSKTPSYVPLPETNVEQSLPAIPRTPTNSLATPDIPAYEPIAGPSSRPIGRVPSRRGRPMTPPTHEDHFMLPSHGSRDAESSLMMEDQAFASMHLQLDGSAPDQNEPELASSDDPQASLVEDEAGMNDARNMLSIAAGSSGLLTIGRSGSLTQHSADEESLPTGQTSWKTFSNAYAHGIFDPNRIPILPTTAMTPLDSYSARSSPGRHYPTMPLPSDVATSSSGSQGAFSSASGSSGASMSTQASSAPPTSAENTLLSAVKASSLAARRKAFEVESLPTRLRSPIRPNQLSLPSYSLAAATVRMATNLRNSDFAPLNMPSPERELLDPMAASMQSENVSSRSSDPGAAKLPLSRSMSSAIGIAPHHYLPTIQASPVSSPSENSYGERVLPELGRRRTSPHSKGGIVHNRIPPASAPIERTVETEITTDYFGSASPHFDRTSSYNSQSSSSLTTVQGTPMRPRAASPMSPTLPPLVAHPQDIGPLYEKLGWLAAPLPPDEEARRRALHRFNILYTAKDINFDRIAHMAKLVFSSKIVLIALTDNDTQWHKSQTGVGAEEAARISSFCSHAVLSRSDEPFIVLNALQDWRFANNPQVVGPPHIRFYAGAPLRTADGHNLGSLCIIDDKPREEFSPRSRLILKEFAAVTIREMELWRDKLQLRVRDKIQTSMERFTRDCLEMEANSASSNAEAAARMEQIYTRAVQLVNSTLDLDGCFVLDISQFEMMETETATGSKTIYRADPYVTELSSPVYERSDTFGPVNPLPVLAKTLPVIPTRPLSAIEHENLSEFLRENKEGRIFENIAPSWIRYMFPSSLGYGMVVPVFGVDLQPFAMLCAYTSRQFLEGYELQFLRAIGVIILSAVLRRRMVLADKAKSILISSVSHELRTPLHGILAAAELLSDTRLDANQISFLKTVQTCGNSLIETVDHVLDFTKLSGSTRTQGGSRITVARVNLANLVEQTVEGCWIGQRARVFHGDSDIGSFYAPPGSKDQRDVSGEASVEMVIDIAQREKGWNVKCEKGGLRRVLMNLVGNSLKFTKDGYVQVTLRELPHSPGSRMIPIEMAVIDTGKGISKGFLKEQLFQPFSQENPLQTGTGLGLAIVNSIVRSENVNGKVDVWSSEGMGTEIRVSFDAEVVDEEEDCSSASSTASITSSFVRGQSLSLLAFDTAHRGHMLSLEVLGAYAAAWHFNFEDDGDILVINEDESVLNDKLTLRRPIIFLLTERRPGATAIRDRVNNAGGYCQILYKPVGPQAFRTTLHSAVDWIESKGYERPTLSRGASGVSQESQESNSTISELSSNRFDRPVLDSRIPLTRRRSEEKEQQSTRPIMAPRGVTYHAPRRASLDEEPPSRESPGLSSPTSTISTISLADGGVMLKTAALPLELPRRDRVARIMVVEDNVINRRVLGAFLKKKGIEYTEAVNGKAGVDLFESTPSNHWDIILMDISMPVMNGHEATRAIRKVEATRRRHSLTDSPALPSPTKSVSFPLMVPPPKIVQARAKIFALTGLATADDRREAFGSGVDGYLVKPVSLASLDMIFKKIGF